MSMKKIELFQPYLRKHILNFGLFLKDYAFDVKYRALGHKPTKKLSIREAFYATKGGWLARVRRIFGIPNIRIKWSGDDLIFTYGSLLIITNKPYCTYIENSVALFDYDPEIARHPIAQYIVKKLILKKNCKHLIFMSEKALKGFLNSIKTSTEEFRTIQRKCIPCYPLIKNPTEKISARKIPENGNVKFLYIGTFYIKGGLETIRVFSKLKTKYPNISLTVVTGLDMIYPEDIKLMRDTPGINILEANFNEKELFENIYNTHDVLIYPTYRDGFGLVLIEIMAAGLPVIGTDQYATSEMIINEKNGILIQDHPLKDYDPKTFVIGGKYRQPKDFYTKFFELQKTGGFEKIEADLYKSMERIILHPELVEHYSKGALSLYDEKFDYRKISEKIEKIFSESIEK